MTRFGTLTRRVDQRGRGIDLPLLSVSQFHGVIRRSEISDGPHRAESLDDYKIARRGDIVFNKMSIRDGAMGLAKEDGLVTYHYEVMRPTPGTDARFVVHLMKSAWFIAELIKRERGIGAGGAKGVRTTEVPYRVLRTIDCYIPDSAGQRAIADFLDRETAQIDAMIDAQKIVRERLFELRSALAERLIIYGVSGSAGFRESGLPWAPELPAHWQVGKVLRGYTVTLGKMLDEKRVSFVDDVQTPYIRAANIQDHGLDLSDVKTMPFRPIELRRLDLRAGDLLVVEGGSIGTNVVLANDLPDFSFQKTVNRARPRSEHDSRYLGHWLKMLRDHGVLAMMGNQSTIAHFTAEKLEALPVPFPPASEQREIADRIEAQTRDLDRSIEAAIDLEALLRERREALISAAVTGRIDPTTGVERIDPTTEREAS